MNIHSHLDLNQLQIFLVVAETKNLKTSAILLNISPSAVTQSLNSLEQKLTLKLLDRSTRPIKLTESGRLLETETRSLLDHASLIQQNLLKVDPFNVPLRLGYTESIRDTLSPWLYADLLPRVSALSVHSQMPELLLNDFQQDFLDVVVLPHVANPQSYLYRKALWKERFLLVTPKNSPEISSIRGLHQLAQSLPLLQYNMESWDRIQITRTLRSLGLAGLKKLSVDSSYGLMGLVAQGMGWALLAPLAIHVGRRFSPLVRIQALDFIETSRTFWALATKPNYEALTGFVATTAQNTLKTHIYSTLNHVSPLLKENIQLID